MSTVLSPATSAINAIPVPGHLRMQTLPRRFPGLFLVFENNVYDHMNKFAKSYKSGYWEFIELSNGGFYMSLKSDKKFFVEIDSNYFEGTMSADAASLVANLFVYSRLAEQHNLDYLIEGFHALYEYARLHPEGQLILSAIN
ncbi:antirestriction protein [Cellvibrio sp. KY-GH-1]|uniref:antirestriction protein n=1 Tax=Cellvibrio sp. KY-GH-1 TaxID=2303332 RepID=UPI001246DFDD|nr:antirestriction protein [Cellvibrio sp. KY-GH-1]QEY16021.1 antirestriction protein [Cellvibrio sp. KY-GH-1]